MQEDPAFDQRSAVDGGSAGHGRSAADGGHGRFRPRHLWYLLLVVQFAGVLITGIYNRETPKLGGIPFFYWYQFAWILASVLLTGIVYFATREK